jgi:hypothetical protein
MKMEQYDVETIRNEYVSVVAKKLQGKIKQDDFEKMLTLLDDFLLALASNNIMLIKVTNEGDQILPPSTPVDEPLNEPLKVPTRDKPVEKKFRYDLPPEAQEEEPTEEVDEFEEPVEAPSDLSEVYKRKIAELEAREKALYELENAKPVKFTDRIRQFETTSKDKKKQIDEDEE